MAECLDEIERLRAENKTLRETQANSSLAQDRVMREQLAKFQAECEGEK